MTEAQYLRGKGGALEGQGGSPCSLQHQNGQQVIRMAQWVKCLLFKCKDRILILSIHANTRWFTRIPSGQDTESGVPGASLLDRLVESATLSSNEKPHLSI